MRVLIAPDDFKGTLTAREAAEAMAAGWQRVRPRDELDLAPMSDGGPGFVDIVSGELTCRTVTGAVRGPLDEPVIVRIALVGSTAYVESAQACGLDLLAEHRRDSRRTSTYGVGEAISLAIDAGATCVIVGLGGTSTTDGGAGALAALGARAVDAHGHDVALDGGGDCLGHVARVDVEVALSRIRDVDLVIATDVTAPLLGPAGAAYGYSRQKGASTRDVEILESNLAHWAAVLLASGGGVDVAEIAGAGAAGGLGFGLLAIGARVVSGFAAVSQATALPGRIAQADVVLTGEGALDWQSLQGKVVLQVAALARGAACPVVVIVGRDDLPVRERPAGIVRVLSIVDAERSGAEGNGQTELRDHAEVLAALTAEEAARWSTD